jgi:hypothetical protein
VFTAHHVFARGRNLKGCASETLAMHFTHSLLCGGRVLSD